MQQNQTSQRLLSALDKLLAQLGQEDRPDLERIQLSILYCKKALKIIRRAVYQHVFDTPGAEIYFFKFIKPLFYSKFIYYVNIYKYLIQRPLGGKDALQAYISFHLADLQRFFDSNKAFYQYYRSGGEQMDHSYFIRGGLKVQVEPEEFEEDEHYATTHDYKLSKIIANEKFQDYLNLELLKLNADPEEVLLKLPFKRPHWTAAKVDAVELVYALKASGAVNGGNIDIAELVTLWEYTFQIDLKESYHKFTDITNRKKEIPVFLTKLTNALLRWITDKMGL